MNRKRVEKIIFLLLIVLFVGTIYLAIHLFDLTAVEVKSEPFEYPKENTMKPKPLVE